MLRRLRASTKGDQVSRTVYVSPPSRADDTEVPRYPPFQQGLPAAEPRRLLAPQWDIVRSIQHTLALERGEFERLVLPVIERYAAFVHLLPASERHHHRLAGGLLRHGLEVACWAARAAEGVVFVGGGTPLERKSLEPRWRIAVCLAGLLHDVGKAGADVSVTSNDGAHRWNPHRGALYDWARAHKLTRYFLHWRPDRHGRHENFSVFLAHYILTEDAVDWLNEPGPAIVQALFEAIGSTAVPEDRFARLVNAADGESMQRDLKSPHYGGSDDNPHGVPADQYLLDAMRRLLTSGEWSVNQRGARVWNTNHGLFIVWKHACEDIHRLLAHGGAQGIPRDAATLAEILLERELAIPHVDRRGEKHPMWPVAPQPLDTPDGERVVLQMLRLKGPQVLFGSEPPAPVPAYIDDASLAPTKTSGPLSAEETAVEPTARPDAPSAEGDGRTVILSDAPSRSAPPPSTADATASSGRPRERARPRARRAAPRSASARDKGSEASPLPSGSDEAQASEGRTAQGAQANIGPTLPGRASEILTAMARDIAAGKRAWGEALALVGSDVIVRYPDAVAAYGNPTEILNALSEADWIVLDPISPVKKVREREGIRGLVLAQKPAAAVIALARTLPARTADPRNDLSATPPHASSTGDQPAGHRGRETATEEVADQAETLVRLVRARDPQIGGGMSEEGGWLRLPRSVLSSFLDTHPGAASLAQLRKAIEQRHDVRLDVDYLYVRETGAEG
nr:MobH family relaxase [Sulfurifustis variabilis]